jgi:DNA-binding FadR family transcriptional regulator
MRKPVSKHALRRAMEKIQAEGLLQWDEPTGTVVDRVWHEIERSAYSAARKRPADRETIRAAAAPAAV